jgi:hypothetical protein
MATKQCDIVKKSVMTDVRSPLAFGVAASWIDGHMPSA